MLNEWWCGGVLCFFPSFDRVTGPDRHSGIARGLYMETSTGQDDQREPLEVGYCV